MAAEPKRNQRKPTPHIRNDEIVSKIVSDPSKPERLILLRGYIGETGNKDYIRLYFDIELNNFIDIPMEGIVFNKELSLEQSPFGGSYLWVKRSTVYLYGNPSVAERPKASFLQGDIYAEYLKRRNSYQRGRSHKPNYNYYTLSCPYPNITLGCHPTEFCTGDCHTEFCPATSDCPTHDYCPPPVTVGCETVDCPPPPTIDCGGKYVTQGICTTIGLCHTLNFCPATSDGCYSVLACPDPITFSCETVNCQTVGCETDFCGGNYGSFNPYSSYRKRSLGKRK
jgi:hypothetical protein